MHAVRTQLCVSANTRTLVLGPLHKFFVPYRGCFGFLCIGDVAYLNCHPFLPIFNHFYPFSIPLFLPTMGPREGKGDAAILIYPHHGDPEKARVMQPY